VSRYFIETNFCVFLHSFSLRRLSATLDFPFAALSAEAGAASAAPSSFAISKLVKVFDKIRTYFKGSGG
jgi:hypothetical protein